MTSLKLEMANTTKTPRARWRCPVCQVRFNTNKELEDHILACVKKRSSEEEYLCDLCMYAASRKSDFTRHQRRRHTASLSAMEDTDSELEKQNQKTLSDVHWEPSKSKTSSTSTSVMATGSLIKGRVARKTTSPQPVVNPSRKRLLDTLRSSWGPQKIAFKRFDLPRLPATTATIMVPHLSSSFNTKGGWYWFGWKFHVKPYIVVVLVLAYGRRNCYNNYNRNHSKKCTSTCCQACGHLWVDAGREKNHETIKGKR